MSASVSIPSSSGLTELCSNFASAYSPQPPATYPALMRAFVRLWTAQKQGSAALVPGRRAAVR